MINNITQVNPENRVDFSKIRKASQGIKIPKFLTPAGGILQWYLDRYASNNALGGWNSSLDSSYAGSTIVGEGNSSLHGKAGDLNAAWTGNQTYTSNSERVGQDIQYWVNEWVKQNPNATDDQIVNAYNQIAQQIRDYLSQGHTYNSKGAATTNRAFKTMFSSRSLKSDPNSDMSGDLAFIGYQDKGDDIYGSSSFLRRMDLYEKEYDDLTDDEKAARTHTIKVGDRDVQVYKKANGDISLLPSDPPGGGDIPKTPPGGGDIPKDIPGDYTPDDYYNFQFKPEPFLTPNPFIAGLGLAANRHLFMNEMNKKVPLLEAPYLQGKVTNNYAARQMRNLQMADIRSQAQRQLGSDMVQNQLYLQAVEQGLQPLENLNVADLTQEFNSTSQNLQNIENQNKLASAQVANQNRTNLIADWNRRLDARSKYQWTRNNIKSDFINKTWTDYQQWAAGEKNERDSALFAYNDYLANLDMQKVMREYNDLATDPTKSRSFAAIYQKAHNDFDSNLHDDAWLKANPELEKLFMNESGLNQNQLNEAFMDYLRTGNSDYTASFNQGYNSELNTAKNKAIVDRQRIQNLLAQIYPSFRNTYIGGWGPWDRRHLGRMYRTIYEKNGGILKMKYGSRFVDYLEHNRKAIKDQKLTTMEVSKQMERELKALLDSIDRETLILLRSIFK